MKLTQATFANMVESVAINPHDTIREMDQLIEDAKKYKYHIVYVCHAFTDYMIENLKGSDTLVGGTVGNASGAGEEDLAVKKFMAEECMEKGVGEVDMFMNVPLLRSGKYDAIYEEVKAVRDICKDSLLKVIIQTPMLTNDEIKTASEIIVKAGGDFVKTGNGFYGPTTLEAVKIIKDTVGDKARIKAAGGIKGIDMVEELVELGVSRIGMSNPKTAKMMEELAK